MAGPGQERYKLEEWLGEGGFGEVWLATDTLLDRRVAIKSLKAAHDLIHRGRFRGEARMLARLNHPNITAIYDVNFDEAADRFYLVTEYVEGKPLSEVLKSGQPLPLDVVLDIALGVLRALSYAHGQGVIHRDVTPGNVMIADDVKLADFGLANLASRLQRGTSFMAGTLAYMSPEQIEGRPTDGRADLYSLGVLLFELLTGGRRPFEQRDEDELLEAHLHAPRPPLRLFAPQVPLALEYVVTRLLAKDAEDRYPSADAVMEVLESIQARLRFSRPRLQLLEHDLKALIGRTRELAQIEAVWGHVQSSCHPRLLVLRGEMGVGKHKLVAEFLRRIVDQGCVALTGRCDPSGAPYAPYAEILATIFNTESLKLALPMEGLELFLSQVPGLAARLDISPSALAQDVSPDVQRAGWQLFEAALAILADLGPAVLFLEDATLLDEASLALTRHLIHQGRGWPLLFIAACRDDGAEIPWLSALRPDDVAVMTLGPLSEAAAKEYLAQLLDGPVSVSLVGALYGKSGGIPFYIDAITGQMIEAGELFESETGEWRYTPVEKPEPKAPRHNLPAPLTPFIGREAVLAEIKERLGDPTCRLLTLIGPGGIGKTRLALEAAAEILSEDQGDIYPHGVFFVPLAALQSVEAIVPTVAKALGFSFYEGGEPKQQLLDYVHQKSMLIILDSFEHMLVPPSVPPEGGDVGGAELVTELLQAAPDVDILTTSRTRLNVQGEHLLTVVGMKFPDQASVDDVGQYSAVQLFLRSARRAQPSFEPTATDLADIVRICRLVDGTPLAILLAAAWMELLTPAEIVTEISRNLDFLEADLCDVPVRHRSMRAVFDHSWNLLTESEREVFQALSVFRGGFTWQAARHVTSASLRQLMALVHKSLLQRAPTGRYGVHELLRQCAGEKLDESPTAGRVVRDRHCAFYAAALQSWAEDLKSWRQRTALTEIDLEIQNARAAWNWAVKRGQVERLEQAMEGLARFYETRGRFDEALEAYGLACTLLSQDAPSTFVAEFYRRMAVVHERKAEYPIALDWLMRGLELLGDQDHVEKARIYNWGGGVYYRLGDRERALEWRQRALQIAQRLGDQREIADAYLIMAMVYSDWGETDRALDYGRQCLEAFEAAGDLAGSVKARLNVGLVSYRADDWAQALEHYREGLRLSEMMNDGLRIGQFSSNMGNVYLSQGNLEQAAAAYRRSIAALQPMGFLGGIIVLRINLGKVAVTQGDLEAGAAYLSDALALAQEIGARGFFPEIYRWQALLELAQHEYDEALALIRQAYQLSQELKDRVEEGGALRVLGRVYQSIGQPDEAFEHLAASLLRFVELKNTYEAAKTCFHLALVCLDRPDWTEDGRGLLAHVRALFAELGAHWDLAQVERVYDEQEEDGGSQLLIRQGVSEPGGLEEQPIASTRQPIATVSVPSVPVRLLANRFEIRDLKNDLLGRGETGYVYRGIDTHSGQAVAIKALKPEVVTTQPDIMARFVREGEALRQLNHPNIVKMVAAVEEAGRHYIIEEYVAGGSLRDLLGETRPQGSARPLGSLPITHALQIALELADALARAHHLGIIHRDLKPANVLLAEDGTPRLTDFGHAHVAASPRLTRTGALVGSVGYLSPEACNGEPLDHRADIWSLGVLLYEMLTGELPFVGETLIAAITAILTQPVPDLAVRRPDLPDALVELIGSTLEKDRDERVPSARQMGAELEAILAALREE